MSLLCYHKTNQLGAVDDIAFGLVLQVQNKHGEWVSGNQDPDKVLLLLGTAMVRWTGGVLRAPVCIFIFMKTKYQSHY